VIRDFTNIGVTQVKQTANYLSKKIFDIIRFEIIVSKTSELGVLK